MAFTIKGVSIDSGSTDEDGYQEYKVTYLLLGEQGDGPATANQTPGLPQPYSLYNMAALAAQLGVPGGFSSTESDANVWCHWDQSCEPKVKDESTSPNYYVFHQRFSSKPEKRCRKNPVEDPLLEPPVISGNTSKYTEEATRDRFGRPITNSAFEQIRGAINEWDHNRISIKIVQNMATAFLGYVLPTNMLDCVNDAPLWGLPMRTVKLSSCPWELKFNGPCQPYYVRTLEFEVRYQLQDDGTYETWDRQAVDEATKMLSGTWSGNPTIGLTYNVGTTVNRNSPTSYVRATDWQGNQLKTILLNGAGIPALVMSPSKTQFLSLQDANVGKSLSDSAWWFPIAGDPTAIADWDTTVPYNPGNIVITNRDTSPTIWIALNQNVNSSPQSSFDWQFVVDGTTLFNGSNYLITSTYPAGAYVGTPGYTGNVGTIYVSKYPGVDFTQLSIPLSF